MRKEFFVYIYSLLPETLTVFLIGSSFFLSQHPLGGLNPEILDNHVRLFGLVSTHYQRCFYLIAFVIIALSCAFILLVRKPLELMPNENIKNICLVIVVICAFSLGSWKNEHALVFSFYVLGFIAYSWNEKSRDVFSGILFSCRRNSSVLHSIGWVTILLFMLLFWLIPTFSPGFVGSLSHLQSIDIHYAFTVLSGFDFLSNNDFLIKSANYGVGMPLFIALFYKGANYLRIPGVELFHAVMLYQFIALILMGIIAGVICKRNFIIPFFLVVILTLFTLSNIGIAVWYPNQSGIRYIPILLGLLVFYLELKRRTLRGWVLASTSAIVVIFNPETGFALTVGLIVAAVLSQYENLKPVLSISRTLVNFFVIFGLTFVFMFYLVASPLLNTGGGSIFKFLGLFGGGGYGGAIERLSLNASLIFFVAVTVLLRISVKAKSGVMLKVDIWQAAIASVMLVWLFYYFNRMSEWNLWFQWVLFVFAFMTHFDLTISKLESPKSKETHTLFIALVCCLIGAQSIYSTNVGFKQLRLWIQNYNTGCLDEDILDGFCLPGLEKNGISKQFAVLNVFRPSNSIVLSGFSTAVRLKGFNDKFPLLSPLEVAFKKDVPKIVEWFEKEGPRYILADGPTSLATLASPEHTEQIWLYLTSLKRYHEIERRHGWVIFERIKDNEGMSRTSVH